MEGCFTFQGGGLCFRFGLHFQVEGHPMGGINFDGAVLKQIVGWGGGGALTLENPGPILHVAGVLDAPLILLF